MVLATFLAWHLLFVLSHAIPVTPSDSSILNTRQETGAPEYVCEPAIGDNQYCRPVTGDWKIQEGNNIFGGITTELSQEEYPLNAGSSRYNVVIQDRDELIRRQDLELSPYGTQGLNLRIAEGRSFSQTWSITGTGGIQPQGIGATLAFAYAETYTVDSQLAISCDVTDAVGVLVVAPMVNYRAGWIIQTDNILFLGDQPAQVVTKVFRWETDIPLKESGGFVQGTYDCCGGADIPFACCFGDCTHVGGTRE